MTDPLPTQSDGGCFGRWAGSTRAERVDDFVERWHKAPPGELDGPLHEEMGWTWDEYAAFLERGEFPPEREGAI